MLLCAVLTASIHAQSDWHILFDGSNLEGWRSNDEVPNAFSIDENGSLKVAGGRAHLFWQGKDGIPADFKNFEWQAEVMTTPGANSGVFFHTKFQERNWPFWGIEAQVNSTHKDPRKTGSVYAKKDVLNVSPQKDDVWFVYNVKIEGNTVTVSVDGEVVNTYVEPEKLNLPPKRNNTRLGKGTIAIQGHDPKSVVYFRNMKIREL